MTHKTVPIASPRAIALLDGAALCTSGFCLIHCLLLPLALLVLPGLDRALGSSEWFHVAALAFALPVSAAALLAGWRAHRSIAPALVGAAGLLAMSLALLAATAQWETALTVAGSLAVAAAHLRNWRMRRVVQ